MTCLSLGNALSAGLRNQIVSLTLLDGLTWRSFIASAVDSRLLPPASDVSFALIQLTVFKPFFISLHLPYSIVRGEEFVLIVSVFNYLTTAVDVRRSFH